MAQLVVAAAGAAIGGSLITGTVLGMTGASIGWMAGSFIGGQLFGPKGQDVQGPRLGDLRVSGTEYGQTIPWVAGSPRIAGQIIWASRKRETANTQEAGGKGGGGGGSVTTYTYDVDLLILLSSTETQGVSRVWSNGELVFDGVLVTSGVWQDLRVYDGALGQLPDPDYEADVGVGNAPAYRGMTTALIKGLQLGSSGQIPNLTFEINSREIALNTATYLGNLPGRIAGFFSDGVGPTSNVRPAAGGQMRWMSARWDTTYSSNLLHINRFDPAANSLTTEFSANIGAPLSNDNRGIPYGGGDFVADCLALMMLSFGAGNAFIVIREVGGALQTTYVQNPLPSVTPFAKAALRGDVLHTSVDNTIRRHAFNGAGIAAPSAILASRTFAGQFVQSMANAGARLFAVLSPTKVNTSSSTGIAVLDPSTLATQMTISLAGISQLVLGADDRVYAFSAVSRDIYVWTEARQAFVLWARMQWTPLADSAMLPTLVAGPWVYRGYQSSDVAFSPAGVWRGRLSFGAATGLPIKDAVDEILSLAGVSADERDTSALSSEAVPLRAFSSSNVSSARALLEILQAAWFFDVSSTDSIRVRPRAASAAQIGYASLGVSPEGNAEPFAATLSTDLEVPAAIALSYHNMAADYAVATEHSDRPAAAQESVQVVQMPIGLLPSEAKQIVDKMMSDLCVRSQRSQINVGPQFAAIEPGDAVLVTDAQGRQNSMRVQSKKETWPVIAFELLADELSALQSSAATDAGYVSIVDAASIAASSFVAMDIPLLRDADDAPGYYAAVGARRVETFDTWPGAAFLQAFSPEQFERAFVSGNSAIIGDCLTTLPTFALGNVFDEASTVEVRVSGELFSTTRDSMLNDLTVNAALIGSEIVRFRVATLINTDGARRTYRLSGLLRGQRGTEWAISGHAANERFVLLRASDLRRVESTLAQIGLARDVKGVTLNQLLSSVTAVSFTNTGESLRPLSPVNPRVLANGGGMAVSWQRRTRRAVRYGGAVDQVVPLGEASEQYRVRVIRAGTTLRTVTVTTPAWTYLAADIAADGVTAGQSLTFEIRQLSAVVGEGRAASITGVAP